MSAIGDVTAITLMRFSPRSVQAAREIQSAAACAHYR
jgi:hypothetical protein